MAGEIDIEKKRLDFNIAYKVYSESLDEECDRHNSRIIEIKEAFERSKENFLEEK